MALLKQRPKICMPGVAKSVLRCLAAGRRRAEETGGGKLERTVSHDFARCISVRSLMKDRRVYHTNTIFFYVTVRHKKQFTA